MVERIGRIVGIKGIASEQAFERKEGYEDRADHQAFAKVLQKAMGAKNDTRATTAAYNLTLSTLPTQSLFYGTGMDFSQLTEKLS